MTEASENHLRNIAAAVNMIESKFYFSDQLTLNANSLSLTALTSGKTVKFPISLIEAAEGALAPLLEVADDSPFGAGDKTIVDPQVRSALQLKPEQFSIDNDLEIITPAILEKIRLALVPDTASITAVLDKLNIYPKGGHFLEHRDTPQSETSFGSLVVLLPVSFKGGLLQLVNQNIVVRFPG